MTVLAGAQKCLKEIYGEYDIDENQVDRPDAAIISHPLKDEVLGRRIGIEITTVDPQNALEYHNEEKSIESLNIKRVNAYLRKEELSTQPAKNATIKLPKEYISDGIKGKKEKYLEYNKKGIFDQLVLIASSEFLWEDDDLLRYHAQWTNFLLSKAKCPYDYVILVLEKVGRCMLIYDRQKPSTKEPEDDMAPTFEFLRSGFMPMGCVSSGWGTAPAIEMRPNKKR